MGARAREQQCRLWRALQGAMPMSELPVAQVAQSGSNVRHIGGGWGEAGQPPAARCSRLRGQATARDWLPAHYCCSGSP